MTELTPAQAQAGLDAAERGRLRVVEQIDVPGWYWWSVAAGWVALGVLTDVASPWVLLIGTLAFGTAHSVIAPRVVDGRHGSDRLRVRTEVAGRHVAQLVIGGLVVLVGITVAVAVALEADGARHPATGASLVVAVMILLGGPLLLARVRRRARRGGAV